MIAVLIPGSTIPDVRFVGVDKLVHISMFLAWAVAIRFDFQSVKPWLVFVLGIVFSALTEVVQLFTEGRSFDFFDMLFDGVGLLIGVLISKAVIKIIHRLFRLRT
jgi:VanZ family protein